jgi:two-component system cell cycle response regulator
VPARILIVEDNAANLDLMAYLLEAYGHSVTRANDGEAGLDKVKQAPYDLILADILMPKMDGYEFVRRAKDQVADCAPIIAVTALAMVGDRELVLRSGFDGYIAKPINPETFVHEVDHYLEGDLRSKRPVSRESPARPDHARVEATGLTILIVDDVAANSEVVRAALEPFGHRVVEARSMDAAVRTAKAGLPDLVLADVHMPDGTGYDLIKAFKADPDLAVVPFIFLSSTYWHELDRARGIALGAEKFLLRPIDPNVLLDEIADTLNRRRG